MYKFHCYKFAVIRYNVSYRFKKKLQISLPLAARTRAKYDFQPALGAFIVASPNMTMPFFSGSLSMLLSLTNSVLKMLVSLDSVQWMSAYFILIWKMN